MNGSRTVQELYEINIDSLGDNALNQNEIIELLGKLYNAEVLQSDVPTEATELFAQQSRQRRAKRVGQAKNPLAIKIPLFDPDRLLDSLTPLGQILFSRIGALLWLAVVGVALVLAATHWAEIVNDTTINVLSPQNLFLLALCYPFIKVLHELGHGLATKAWGGEVHETGIILLALIPVPYVDASSSSTFSRKHQRMLVSAAGIIVEMFLAALALLVWLNTEPGLVRSLAYNTMLIGSVSTLLFNGNPLLRFDGYYVFSDGVGIPNLSSCSTRYLGYLVQRYLFGVIAAVSPATTPDERPWLLVYGILAYLYRIAILIFIMLYVAETYPVVGTIIAAWAALTLLIIPAVKHVHFLFTAPRLQRNRTRAVFASFALTVSVAAILFGVPMPLSTMAEGVVVPPDHSEVRAATDGVVARFVAKPDTRVSKGDPLLETEDPLLRSQLRILEAKLRELTAKQHALQVDREQVKADILQEQIKVVEADLVSTNERAGSLVIHSPADGVFLVDQPDDMPGRFVRQGDLIGYVTDLEQPTIHVAVAQADIGLVRTETKAASVRLAGRMDQVITAAIDRQVPAAVNRLPSPALGPLGGGPFAVQSDDQSGTRTTEDIFQMELTLPVTVSRLGERVYVRFDHGKETLAQQWYRSFRQLFMKRFSV